MGAVKLDKQTLEELTSMTRQVRLLWIEEALESYFDDHHEYPDDDDLETLANAILYEELTDPDPDKVTRAEYPFFSEWQMALRDKRTTPLDPVKNVLATDGKAYFEGKKPQKVRLESDGILREHAKERAQRNKARKARNSAATKPSEVVTYWIEPNTHVKKDGA